MRARGAVVRRAAVADAALEESEIVGAGRGGALGVDVPGGAAARIGDSVYGLGREVGGNLPRRWRADARGGRGIWMDRCWETPMVASFKLRREALTYFHFEFE